MRTRSAFRLSEKFPEHDPLSMRFTDLHKLVLNLPDFVGPPDASNESALEAIQMAWLEYYKEKPGE